MKRKGRGGCPTHRGIGKSSGSAGRLAVPYLRAGDSLGMANDGIRRLCRMDDGLEGVQMFRDVRHRDDTVEGRAGIIIPK